ncbi:uncharacterized protein LOC135331537 [Halichondria panicea]|uniref:uncharacterized protein LOC135331537 n=1 Tax=Halichondria panicea TaxID=6063 RepID=UPI00312B5247
MMTTETENESSKTSLSRSLTPTLDTTLRLPHVPYSFQCPAQLLLLKYAQFQKHFSLYHHSLDIAEEHFERTFQHQFREQVLVTGFTFDGLFSENNNWKEDLLLALNDLSPITLSKCCSSVIVHEEYNNGKLNLIDKLDLAELLNGPKTIVSCKDAVRCGAATCRFELTFPFPSFLTGVDNLLGLLLIALSSLLQLPDWSCVSFSDIREFLLQFPFWVHGNYAQAFLETRVENVLVCEEFKGLKVVKVDNGESSPNVFLCFKDGDFVTISGLLKWYRRHLVKRVIGILSSMGDVTSGKLSSLLTGILG